MILTACPYSPDVPSPVSFVVNSTRASVNRFGCNEGLQASIVVNDSLTAESTALPEGGFWSTEIGQSFTSANITVEAYCYREDQPTGYIKVSGNALINRELGVSVTSPFRATEGSCSDDPTNSYQVRVMESTPPIPCVHAVWQSND